MTARRLGITFATGLLVLAVATAACGDDGGGPIVGVPGGTGAELYANNCAVCHGADLMGTVQGPPFLNSIYHPGHHSDEAFLLAVRLGVRAHHWRFGDMPRITGLDEADVRAIVAFVRERQREAGVY